MCGFSDTAISQKLLESGNVTQVLICISKTTDIVRGDTFSMADDLILFNESSFDYLHKVQLASTFI